LATAPELHVAIETAAALSAGLAAYVFFGRYQYDWRSTNPAACDRAGRGLPRR